MPSFNDAKVFLADLAGPHPSPTSAPVQVNSAEREMPVEVVSL